jgi:hypothetical protein
MDNGPSKRRRGQNQGVGATARHAETEHNNRVPRVPGLDQSLVMWAELDSDLSRGPERYQDPEDRKIAETYCTNNVTYKKLRTDPAARQQRDTESQERPRRRPTCRSLRLPFRLSIREWIYPMIHLRVCTTLCKNTLSNI